MRLVGQRQMSLNLSPAYTNSSSPVSEVRLASKHGKVRTGPHTSVCRLPVRPEGGQGQTHPRAKADLK